MKTYIEKRDFQVFGAAFAVTAFVSLFHILFPSPVFIAILIPLCFLVFALATNYLVRRHQACQIYERDPAQNYYQIESLLNLFNTLKFEKPLPRFRNWAVSPDCCVELVKLIQQSEIKTIAECGSGISTLVSAQALKQQGRGGHVYSLESDEEYAEKTRAILRQHALEDYATVITAPIEPVEIEGRSYDWYSNAGLEQIPDSVDLLFVDGPPATRPDARFPAWILLKPKMANNATIVLDDYIRPGEKMIAKSWIEGIGPSLVRKTELQTEKGTCILELAHSTAANSRQ